MLGDTMLRSVLVAVAAAATVVVASGTGCNSTGVGDPCVPELEFQQAFLGFSISEVSVESKSFQCQTRACLVNHFQGRVSCPYGQTSSPGSIIGVGPGGTAGQTAPDPTACKTPTLENPINGVVQFSGGNTPQGYVETNPAQGATVDPQCTLRTADVAVYCSCRCANTSGQTNDGFNYCTCPDGFSCTQVLSTIGVGNEGLAGAYCIKAGTAYDPTMDCSAGNECTATKTGNVWKGNCGAAPLENIVAQ
jgi:hypothetical protein